MTTYLYPQARELREIGPNLMAQSVLNDPLLGRVLPITTVNAPMLQWSLEDDDLGLQQLRGLDGAPVHVQRLGKSMFASEPGYYGEFETITERELTLRGGSMFGPGTVDIGDLVARCYRQLRTREVTRIRQIGWTLLSTGTFSISGKGSTLVYTDTFAVQSGTGSAWGTPSTGTPLADLRTVQQTGSQYGVTFGSSAVAVMNRITANKMLANTNTADLGGRRTLGGGTINSIQETNRIIMGEDLPEIAIMDDGYKNDAGTFVRFIADNKVVILGTRSAGDRIGEYRMTRNLNNPDGAPGHYEYIKDYAQGLNAPKETPPRIEIHGGHNGGCVLFRPKAIYVLTVT